MLRLKTLGGWSAIDHAGAPRPLPGQRVALLALLAATGERGVPRDRVVALLWPDSADENARHSLGQTLYALRRDAASAHVVLGSATLRLNPEVVQCDAWDVEVAIRNRDFDRVAELYGGPFLEGVHLRGSAELQQMIGAERVRLARLHAQAVEALARSAAERGDAAAAVGWWRRLAATDPLSSRVAIGLVESLVLAGDKGAALQAARVHETLVREELDAEPDPAFLTYVAALRRGPRPDAGAELGAVNAPATTSSAAPEPQRTPPATAAVAASNPTPDVSSDMPDGDRARPRRVGSRRLARPFLWAGGATVASVALLLGAQRHEGSAPSLDAKRVYVAWFENRTGDRALDALGGMASDWVSQSLGQSGVVTVVTGTRAEDASVSTADGVVGGDIARRAAELGAGAIVSGAYYRVGDRLRFHVQISDVARGELLDSFDSEGGTPNDPAEPLEAVRQRAIGGLAALVDPRLSSWVRVASKPPSYEAYREFVTGQSIWGSDHRQALAHFTRAAALDSTFYAARVEAAILHRLVGECDQTEAIAGAMGRRAEALAPYEYYVLDEQVALCAGDWERAYRRARAVADLRPGSAFLEYSVALQAMQLGRFSEARALLAGHALTEGSAEVGPNYGMVYAIVLSATGDAPRSREVARWVRGRYPGYAGAWVTEAVLLARQARSREAMALLDTMVAVSPRPAAAVTNGLRRTAAALEAIGDTADARACLTSALAILERQPAGRAERAQVLYELGRLDEAGRALAALARDDSADVDVWGHLGLVSARRGDAAGALEADRWLATTRSRHVQTHDLYRARIAAVLGDRERALGLLATALDRAGRFSLPAVREMRELATLRGDERFERLVRPR